MTNNLPQTADFRPTKKFFVDMLTRDIDLEDAILDLLDNSLDGVARSQKKNPNDIDYSGYEVSIEFSKNSFEIKDNCGGIPADSIDYAFRMGKPDTAPKEKLATVGVYGIGMKRSIFKMGLHCEIETFSHNSEGFKVALDESWMKSDMLWNVPVQASINMEDGKAGTSIKITKLHKVISDNFASKTFRTKLTNKIIYAYSYILSKGFSVKLNGESINPIPVNLRYEFQSEDDSAIEPYMYSANIEGVQVDLIVGFYSPLATEKDEELDKYEPRYETKNAGWTIVCNDRIVVYKDKTELTGWGSDFAGYHTQFISISGIVYFRSDEPDKLPITTTKRGVDISSPLFLKVRKHIVEGTKLFIDYTNKWKGEELIKTSNERLSKAESSSPIDILNVYKESKPESWINVRNKKDEIKYKPKLPIPKDLERRKRISFMKTSESLDLVAEYLSLDDGVTSNQIGEACFDYVLREAEK